VRSRVAEEPTTAPASRSRPGEEGSVQRERVGLPRCSGRQGLAGRGFAPGPLAGAAARMSKRRVAGSAADGRVAPPLPRSAALALALALAVAATAAVGGGAAQRAWLWLQEQSRRGPASTAAGSPSAENEIPVVPWQEGESRRMCAELRRPIVFTGAPSEAWGARAGASALRSVGDLVSAYGGPEVEVAVYESSQTHVLYYKDKMPMAEQGWEPPFRKSKVSVARLSRALGAGGAKGGKLHYYHSAMPNDHFRELLGRGEGEHDLVVEQDEMVFAARPRLAAEAALLANEAMPTFEARWQVHVWAGEANMSARVHYDTYYNFYVQLVGRKRFVLLPPEEWVHLRLFPGMHPSGRQSQFDISERLGSARALEVVLEPGQVLFLPPYWFHHVESVDASVSVNYWTDSRDQWVEHWVASNAIPKGTDADNNQLRQMVFRLLVQVMKAQPLLRAVPQQLLESQFAPLGKVPAPTGGADAEAGRCPFDLGRRIDLAAFADKLAVVIGKRLEEMPLPAPRAIGFGNLLQGVAHWTFGLDMVRYLDCLAREAARMELLQTISSRPNA
jgi:hypothetical protein